MTNREFFEFHHVFLFTRSKRGEEKLTTWADLEFFGPKWWFSRLKYTADVRKKIHSVVSRRTAPSPLPFGSATTAVGPAGPAHQMSSRVGTDAA